MSYRKKEQKIKKIAKIYLLFPFGDSFSYSYPIYPKYFDFRTSVELAYASLSAPLQKIINNDFFYQDYPGWWKLIYKKNNYERLKRLAVTSFLEAFYEM